MRSKLFVLILVLVALGTTIMTAQEVLQYTPDWEAMAARIVSQLDLQRGEKVLLLGLPGRFEDLVPHLRYAVMQSGGVDLGCLDVLALPIRAEWDTRVLASAANRNQHALKQLLEDVDVVIKLPGARGPAPAYLAVQELLDEGKGRAVHFHWDGAFPVNAQDLPSQTQIDIVYQRALLETDYEGLSAVQKRFEAAMRRAEIHVTTPQGTDLRFRIGDRPVSRGDGDVSARRAAQARTIIDLEVELPAGAVRVAPLEDTVEGTIVFPDSTWNGQPVQNLKLQLQSGEIIGYEANSGREAVTAELESAGSTSRSFRGFALGFNPLLAVPERFAWLPYYGYGAGVVRLSLGANADLGGAVEGGYIRWNFFVDATVTIEGQTWVEDGKLVVSQ